MSGSLNIRCIASASADDETQALPLGSVFFDLDIETGQAFDNGTGLVTRNFSSPSAYQALSGIGDGSDVEFATSLFFQANADVLVRVTYEDNSISVLPYAALKPMLLPSQLGNRIAKVEVQGAAKINYFACDSVVP